MVGHAPSHWGFRCVHHRISYEKGRKRYNSICQVPRTAMMIVEEPKLLATRMSCISARGTVDFWDLEKDVPQRPKKERREGAGFKTANMICLYAIWVSRSNPTRLVLEFKSIIHLSICRSVFFNAFIKGYSALVSLWPPQATASENLGTPTKPISLPQESNANEGTLAECIGAVCITALHIPNKQSKESPLEAKKR